ncbi:MAG: PKD domain-containing protein [Phycisphaerae bacterium]
MRKFKRLAWGQTLISTALFCGCVMPTPNNNGNGNSNTNTNNNAGSNTAPVANAGADQSVSRNSAVQLNATGSQDADGDSLQFSWTQTGGTSVTLSSATAAQPTFTAPAGAGSLTFELEVNDGNGGSDEDSVTINVTVPPASLFVANNDTGRITVHQTNALDGEVAPSERIDAGATTSLFQVRSLVVTPGGTLFASRQNGGIVAYDIDGLTEDGTKPADAVIEGNSTELDAPISLAYDAANDLLFVGNVNAGMGVLVFEDVSENSFSGNVAPVRMFSPPDRAPFDNLSMTLDALWLHQGDLYASDTSGLNVNSSRILVFAGAATADGEVAPIRTITSSSFDNIEDITIDSGNRLYVVDGTNVVKIFDDAATVDGNSVPGRMITINMTVDPSIQGIAIGSDGTGYLADRGNDIVYTIEDIAGRNGTVIPDAMLEGFDSRIAGPRQMFLLEP